MSDWPFLYGKLYTQESIGQKSDAKPFIANTFLVTKLSSVQSSVEVLSDYYLNHV